MTIKSSCNANENTNGDITKFAKCEELNNISEKIIHKSSKFIQDISVSGNKYSFTEKVYEEHPEVSQVQPRRYRHGLKSNVLEKLPMIFLICVPQGHEKDFMVILGHINNKRTDRCVWKKYITTATNCEKYKLFIPNTRRKNTFGEKLTQVIIGYPNEGSTEAFFSVGAFDTLEECENLSKYLCGKFSRALISVSAKAQRITPESFAYVPLQNFSNHSDIDWSQPINDIDQQLYHKYELSDDEINFIETHVKELYYEHGYPEEEINFVETHVKEMN